MYYIMIYTNRQPTELIINNSDLRHRFTFSTHTWQLIHILCYFGFHMRIIYSMVYNNIIL